MRQKTQEQILKSDSVRGTETPVGGGGGVGNTQRQKEITKKLQKASETQEGKQQRCQPERDTDREEERDGRRRDKTKIRAMGKSGEPRGSEAMGGERDPESTREKGGHETWTGRDG